MDQINSEGSDLDIRLEGFNRELILLLGKYKLGLGAVPVILSDGRLAAQPKLFDDVRVKEEEPVASADGAETN